MRCTRPCISDGVKTPINELLTNDNANVCIERAA